MIALRCPHRLSSPLWMLGLLAAIGLLFGCALTDKGTPITARYFTPIAAPTTGDGKRVVRSSAWLRLYRIRAGSHLKHKAVFRDSAHEVAFDEKQRWAELPEDYLRRALSRELFERRGLKRVVSGNAPTLEVELMDFDVIRDDDEPRARVSAVMVLHELGLASLEKTIVVNMPLPEDGSDDPRVIAEVMGAALNQLVVRIGERVVGQLGKNVRKRRRGSSPAPRAARAPPAPVAASSPPEDDPPEDDPPEDDPPEDETPEDE